MDLRHSIIKAFFVTGILGLTLAPQDDARGPAAVATGAANATTRQPDEPDIATSSSESSEPTPTSESTLTSASLEAARGPCDEGMVLVEGDYCPEVEQVCLKWLDPPPYQNLRCGEYARPSKCKVSRQRRRFCVDREEFAEAKGADPEVAPMPIVNKSWGEAMALCQGRGARLCKETEWEFACEGPEMSPYPYGWKRDSTLCNFDKTDLGGPMEKLKDLRAPLTAFPECVSPFGIHNMVGNVDEWVERENMAPPNRSALRGGWWLPGRNRCRAATTHHGEGYSAKQVGFRCCKDAPESAASAAPASATP